MLHPFFHIIRWPNLLMVAGIQTLIYFRLLHSQESILTLADFILLSLTTILITASGNVINDYYDADIDRINKPDRWIAGNIVSLKSVRTLYIYLVAWGGVLAVILGWRLNLMPYLIIYPFVVIGLWVYSYALKCKPFIGNFWVAAFCGGVIFIIALPDWLMDRQEVIRPEFWFYLAFAMLSTWYREIIKDLEDAEGDQQMNCQTAIVRYGIPAGKIMALAFGVILLASIFWWLLAQNGWIIRIGLMFLQGVVLFTMLMVWLARDNVYFRRASMWIKGVMVMGTLLLLFL